MMRPRKPIVPLSLKVVPIIFPLSQIYQPDSRKHAGAFSEEGTPLATTVGSMCHLEGTEGLGEGEYEKGKEKGWLGGLWPLLPARRGPSVASDKTLSETSCIWVACLL